MAIIDTGAERSLGNPALLAASGLQAQADDPNSRKQVFCRHIAGGFPHVGLAQSPSR